MSKLRAKKKWVIKNLNAYFKWKKSMCKYYMLYDSKASYCMTSGKGKPIKNKNKWFPEVEGARGTWQIDGVQRIFRAVTIFCMILQWHAFSKTHKCVQNRVKCNKRYKCSLQSLSRVRLFVTSWTAAHQAYLSITNSWSLPKLMSIESVMPSSHLILCRPLLLLPAIPPNIRVFSSESTLRMRWPK